MSKVAKELYVEGVKKIYHNEDTCMADLLSLLKPSENMTLDECFEAYCELMNWSDKDAFLRVNEDDDFCEDITAKKTYGYKEIFKI